MSPFLQYNLHVLVRKNPEFVTRQNLIEQLLQIDLLVESLGEPLAIDYENNSIFSKIRQYPNIWRFQRVNNQSMNVLVYSHYVYAFFFCSKSCQGNDNFDIMFEKKRKMLLDEETFFISFCR